jgi:hypothetical protein
MLKTGNIRNYPLRKGAALNRKTTIRLIQNAYNFDRKWL